MTIRIATWNIAGARKMLSLDRFDYSENEELDYFADQLRALNLDIVCLQESHTGTHDSLSHRLAEKLGMPHVAETPGCPSHIDAAYTLTTAMLSKQPFTAHEAVLLPHPTFKLTFVHSGKTVPPYDRYAQVATFEGFSVATMHTEPLGAFGTEYHTGKGKTLSQAIDNVLVDKLRQPLLFAADFNMNTLSDTLPHLLQTYELTEALPDEPTKPHGGHPDHILYSPAWKKVDAGIVHTQSDHYLCWGEFELRA